MQSYLKKENIHKFVMPVIKSNMYIILCGEQALVIDPHISEDAEKMLIKNRIEEIMILLTHEHYDHVSGVNYFRNHWKCNVYGSKRCQELVMSADGNMSAFFMAMFINRPEIEQKQIKNLLNDSYVCSVDYSFSGEMRWTWNDIHIHMIETPGHSAGSICILINDKYLMTGDSLIPGEKVITRLPGGSKSKYQTITKPFLHGLRKDIIVFPGHGEMGKLSELLL